MSQEKYIGMDVGKTIKAKEHRKLIRAPRCTRCCNEMHRGNIRDPPFHFIPEFPVSQLGLSTSSRCVSSQKLLIHPIIPISDGHLRPA